MFYLVVFFLGEGRTPSGTLGLLLAVHSEIILVGFGLPESNSDLPCIRQNTLPIVPAPENEAVVN